MANRLSSRLEVNLSIWSLPSGSNLLDLSADASQVVITFLVRRGLVFEASGVTGRNPTVTVQPPAPYCTGLQVRIQRLRAVPWG